MATKSTVKEYTDRKVMEPKRYHVIMLNDDFTTMEFVVEILVDIFHKDPVSAESIMLTVHKNGKAVVGTYSYDIALTKINSAMSRAGAEGFPFRLTMEEA
ncbi:MAG: ATP-dependent Clp protease adaptor ClpS [Lachnospiraceae bacterium]|nr:ATP-dependent Clp protease adaptor ClpS [Lachnospiraceae bacterium]